MARASDAMAMRLRRVGQCMLVASLLVLVPACDSPRHPDQALSALALDGRVVDDADILSAEAESRIADRLAQFERRTGHQLVTISVRSLGGHDIADVTRDLGNRWGIGRKEHDDGIILLVAPAERTVRIAVGLGLESILTDELCQQIIDTRIVPLFRKGNLEGGTEAGTEAIIAALSPAP